MHTSQAAPAGRPPGHRVLTNRVPADQEATGHEGTTHEAKGRGRSRGATGGPERRERDVVVDAVLGASRVLVAVAARSLAEAAEEVTLTQYRSLVVLASRGPQSVATLALAVGVTPPTASRLCDRLVRKGLVRRREDPRDRRAVRLGLTEAGRQLVDAVTERRRAEISRLLEAVPLEAQRSMVAALAQLAEVAGEVPEQEWSTGWDL